MNSVLTSKRFSEILYHLVVLFGFVFRARLDISYHRTVECTRLNKRDLNIPVPEFNL